MVSHGYPLPLFKRIRDVNRALEHVVRVIYDLFLFNLIGRTLEPYIEDNNFKLGYRKNVLIASFYLSFYEIQNGESHGRSSSLIPVNN